MLKALPSLQSASQALINFQSCVGEDRSCDSSEGSTGSLQLRVAVVGGRREVQMGWMDQTQRSAPSHTRHGPSTTRSFGGKILVN